LSHDKVALLGVRLGHAQKTLICLVEILACLHDGIPHVPLVHSFKCLQGHLGVQVTQEENKLPLDVFAQEVDVLGEGLLAINIWEGTVAVIVRQAVSHVVQAAMRRQKVSGFIQEVLEILNPRGVERLHEVYEKFFFLIILQGFNQLNGTKELEGLTIGDNFFWESLESGSIPSALSSSYRSTWIYFMTLLSTSRFS
jgi:hypothetical protein